MGLFTSILGAVAGPIAGLFKKKEKPVENRINYKQMVKDAEAAGFNPLTVLRNGASAGYTSQVQHPALSSGFGDVIASGINAFAAYDPMSEKRADLEYQIVEEQLKQLQQKNRNERKSFDVPSYSGGTTVRSAGGFVPSSRGASSATVGGTGPAGAGANTNPWADSVFENFLTIHPGFRDAQLASNRYGEPGEWIIGAGTLGADLYHSAKVNKSNIKAFAMKQGKPALDHWADDGTNWVRSITDPAAAKAKSNYKAWEDETWGPFRQELKHWGEVISTW